MFLLYVPIAIVLIPHRLQLFFPIMAISAIHFSRIKALWVACALGLYLDLAAADGGLGLRATLFVLNMAFLYPYQRLVFEERCFPFSLYSMLFGALYTLSLSVIFTVGPPHFTWSLDFILTDLLLLPFCDAVLGWFLFIAPRLTVDLLQRQLTNLRRKRS